MLSDCPARRAGPGRFFYSDKPDINLRIRDAKNNDDIHIKVPALEIHERKTFRINIRALSSSKDSHENMPRLPP